MSRIVSPPRQKVTVKVTQRHIDEGVRFSPKKDAIARALHAAGLRRWRSGHTSFVVGKFAKRVPMPQQVMEFVKQFDHERYLCKPFEFEIDLTTAKL